MLPELPPAAQDALSRWYQRRYQSNPKATLLLTIAFIAALLIVLVQVARHDRELAEARRKQILDYQVQLSELSKVENSLSNLTEFVRSQKARLQESEDLIAALKTEQRRLAPVVNADRTVVKAILDLQEQQARSGINRERLIGFGLGVLASLVATVLYAFLAPLLRRRLRRRS